MPREQRSTTPGNSIIKQGNLAHYQSQFQIWGIEELLLIACEVGQDKNSIATLSEYTGARVGAALGKVGNRDLGGNWQLTYQDGGTVNQVALNAQAQKLYPGVLETFAAQTTFGTGNDPASVAVGDFNVNQDFLVLDRASFPNPNNLSLFGIATTNRSAGENSSLFVYNRINGSFFYNPDGSTAGFGEGGEFLLLTPGLNLTPTNIIYIPGSSLA